MKIGDRAGQFPVHFFRIRRVFIARPQTGFHMAYFNLRIIGSQCAGKSGGRIPMYQNQVRLHFFNHIFQAQQCFYCHIRQGLPAGHNIQVIVGAKMENP